MLKTLLEISCWPTALTFYNIPPVTRTAISFGISKFQPVTLLPLKIYDHSGWRSADVLHEA